MNIRINGKLCFSDNLNYENIHKAVEDNSYNGLGDAIINKISDSIHNTEWYHHNPDKFDLVQNFNHVEAICGDNLNCYWDAANWSIMNKSPLTADIYKFISHRMAIIREGFRDNLIPNKHLDFGGIFDLIDWHFILDCICWF